MEGFESFFAQHYDAVLRSMTLAVGDRTRAEDLTQEAFARAYRRWESVSMMERPATWVYVVAVNEGRRMFRKDGRVDVVGSPSVAARDDPAGSVAAVVSVQQAVTQLAPRQRAAVVLRYHADLSIAQIAKAMGCSEGTVKSTLHTARAHLRVDLSEDDHEG